MKTTAELPVAESVGDSYATRDTAKSEKIDQALLNYMCSSAIQGVIEEIDYKIALLNKVKRSLLNYFGLD
ncbi:MAG: hypothetical protein WCE81_03035 [Halobacteriota archaeon]